jgi:thiamine-monophosphate kinase
LRAIAEELGIPLSCVGAIRAERGLVVRDEAGRPLPRLPSAFDHFANQ